MQNGLSDHIKKTSANLPNVHRSTSNRYLASCYKRCTRVSPVHLVAENRCSAPAQNGQMRNCRLYSCVSAMDDDFVRVSELKDPKPGEPLMKNSVDCKYI